MLFTCFLAFDCVGIPFVVILFDYIFLTRAAVKATAAAAAADHKRDANNVNFLRDIDSASVKLLL